MRLWSGISVYATRLQAQRVLRQNILDANTFTIPRGPRGTSTEHGGGATAPWERGRLARCCAKRTGKPKVPCVPGKAPRGR